RRRGSAGQAAERSRPGERDGGHARAEAGGVLSCHGHGVPPLSDISAGYLCRISLPDISVGYLCRVRGGSGENAVTVGAPLRDPSRVPDLPGCLPEVSRAESGVAHLTAT